MGLFQKFFGKKKSQLEEDIAKASAWVVKALNFPEELLIRSVYSRRWFLSLESAERTLFENGKGIAGVEKVRMKRGEGVKEKVFTPLIFLLKICLTWYNTLSVSAGAIRRREREGTE